ncbi:MAG: DnaB-like helicase C-terminal domain-containing protein [Bacteroidales bacterium]
MKTKEPLKYLLDQTFTLLESRGKQENPNIGINTGYIDLDKLLGGFQKSTLNIIASRPGMGKSAFIETMMLNMAIQNNLKVLFFSIEASEDMLMQRFLSNRSNIQLREIQQGKLTQEQWQHIDKTSKELLNAKIYIDTTPSIDIDDLCQLVRSNCIDNSIDVVFIDFMQLITTTNTRTISNREQEIGYIARVLKGLSKELNLPIFVTSQLNRRYTEKGIENWRDPVLADLRDSGTLEDVADSVLFIHRPDVFGITVDEDGMPLNGLANIIIAKNRHGSTDTIRFRFKKEFCLFECLIDDLETFTVAREFGENKSPF